MDGKNDLWKPKKKKKIKQVKSFSERLREQGKTNPEFEILFSNLTLEELITLKVELACKMFANNKFYGYPIWNSMENIIKEALLVFTENSNVSRAQAAHFLGITRRRYFTLLRKFNIKKLS